MTAFEYLEWKRLLCALSLFFAVFLGKKIYPDKVLRVGEQVINAVSQSIDLEAVLSDLGSSLQAPGGALEGLEQFCIEVFGPQSQSSQAEPAAPTATLPEITLRKTGLLTDIEDQIALFSPAVPEIAAAEEPVANEVEAVPAVGTVLTIATVETAFPAGYTADQLSFGPLETVTPVLGHLNSGFGYRDHPVDGTYRFHGGADISANAGDIIRAFADGTVEYIGEDDSYGLYLQLDHGDGVKSFYAHCQSLCVQKGQQVAAGETIAFVGATGTVTGPHLHLELKCGSLRVDPAYYVDFLSAS